MKRLLSVAAAVAILVIGASSSAFAIDVQTGGRSNAAVTIGQAVMDRDDVIIDRCECDGGPLSAITVHTADGGTQVVDIDRLMNAVVRTNDASPVEVGIVFDVGNDTSATVRGAITLMVTVRNGSLGDIQRFSMRRTAFYWTANGLVLNASMADLVASVNTVPHAPPPAAPPAAGA